MKGEEAEQRSCLYLKIPKLVKLTNQNREEPEIITSSPYKKNCTKNKKRKLKFTNINSNRNR